LLTLIDIELKKEKEAANSPTDPSQQDSKAQQRKKGSKQSNQINVDLLPPPKYRLNEKGRIIVKNVSSKEFLVAYTFRSTKRDL
jgi:hypothetical protein